MKTNFGFLTKCLVGCLLSLKVINFCASANTNSNNIEKPNQNIKNATIKIIQMQPHLYYGKARKTDLSSSTENQNRRNICKQENIFQISVKTGRTYSKPIVKKITEPCNRNQLCNRTHVTYEPFLDVVIYKPTTQISCGCCPGWAKLSNDSTDCLKPICVIPCKNNGICLKPNTCSCPSGFTGRFCETDIAGHDYDIDLKKKLELLKMRYILFPIGSNDSSSSDQHIENKSERNLENDIDSNDFSSRSHQMENELENDKLKINLESTNFTIDCASRLNKLETELPLIRSQLIEDRNNIQQLKNLFIRISNNITCQQNPKSIYCHGNMKLDMNTL